MRRMSDTDIVITPDDRLAPASAAAPAAAPKLRGFGRRAQPDARLAGDPKPKKAKRKAPRIHLTPLQKLSAGGVAVTAFLVGSAVVWHSGIIQRTTQSAVASVLQATATAGFRIAEVTIAGRGRTPTEQIAGALGARHGEPILGVDIVAVRDRLEALPSVKKAAVERRLPDALHLALVERVPVAIWQNNATHVLVDIEGQQIPGSIAGFEHLPLMVGDGAPARAEELLTLLETAPKIAERVKAAVRVGNRRWNLMLDDVKDGIEVRLPEDRPEAALARLAELENNRQLSGRAVRMVDLRVPDRMVVKTDRPDTADVARRKDNGA